MNNLYRSSSSDDEFHVVLFLRSQPSFRIVDSIVSVLIGPSSRAIRLFLPGSHLIKIPQPFVYQRNSPPSTLLRTHLGVKEPVAGGEICSIDVTNVNFEWLIIRLSATSVQTRSLIAITDSISGLLGVANCGAALNSELYATFDWLKRNLNAFLIGLVREYCPVQQLTIS